MYSRYLGSGSLKNANGTEFCGRFGDLIQFSRLLNLLIKSGAFHITRPLVLMNHFHTLFEISGFFSVVATAHGPGRSLLELCISNNTSINTTMIPTTCTVDGTTCTVLISLE